MRTYVIVLKRQSLSFLATPGAILPQKEKGSQPMSR
jgi:hypothetical protein